MSAAVGAIPEAIVTGLLLAKVDAARADPDEAVELCARLAILSPNASAYVELLADGGALSDAAAKKKLGLASQAFAEAAAGLRGCWRSP